MGFFLAPSVKYFGDPIVGIFMEWFYSFVFTLLLTFPRVFFPSHTSNT